MLEKVLLVIFSFRNNELVCLVVHVVPLMALVTKCEIDSGGENQELKGQPNRRAQTHVLGFVYFCSTSIKPIMDNQE